MSSVDIISGGILVNNLSILSDFNFTVNNHKLDLFKYYWYQYVGEVFRRLKPIN